MPPEDHQGLLLSTTFSLILHLALLSTTNINIPIPVSMQTNPQASARFHVTFAESRVNKHDPAVIAITSPIEALTTDISASSPKPHTERDRSTADSDTTPPTLQSDLSDLWSKQSIQESGKLTLRVLVDSNGRAKRLQVTQSTFSRQTEAQIVKLFFEAKYAPGSRRGKPSDTATEFEVENQ